MTQVLSMFCCCHLQHLSSSPCGYFPPPQATPQWPERGRENKNRQAIEWKGFLFFNNCRAFLMIPRSVRLPTGCTTGRACQKRDDHVVRLVFGCLPPAWPVCQQHCDLLGCNRCHAVHEKQVEKACREFSSSWSFTVVYVEMLHYFR